MSCVKCGYRPIFFTFKFNLNKVRSFQSAESFVFLLVAVVINNLSVTSLFREQMIIKLRLTIMEFSLTPFRSRS